jgi:hypothetical protein
MSVLGANPLLLGGADGDQVLPIQRSVRLRSGNSAYFNRTPATTTNRKTWTWSGWVKRGTLGVLQDVFSCGVASGTFNYVRLAFLADNAIEFLCYDNSAAVQCYLKTAAVFRDPSAWYHVVVNVDTTQATSTNRAQIFINGVQLTSFVTGTFSTTYPTLNADTWMNSNSYPYNIGRNILASNYFDGYLTEVNFIDGQALTPTSFGFFSSTTGVWQPKRYVGTYGTNGFDLNFEDNSGITATTIGKDTSGNNNNWTPNGISITAGATYDSMIDTPTPYSDGGNNRGNYPTLLVNASQGSGAYSDGNLGFKSSVANQWKGAHASMFSPSGKFYFEATIQALSANNFFMIGACGIQTTNTLYANLTGQVANGWGVQCNGGTGGTKYNNNATVNVSNASFASWVAGNTLQCAVDVTNGRIWFGKNNVWLEGNPSAGTGASYTNLTGAIAPSVSVYGTGVDKLAVNCGQRPFAYTPPTGFVALNSFNLPDSTIPNGATQFAATTYTGTGSSLAISNTVNGNSFQPNFVWIKGRSGATDHALYDSVRGTTLDLVSNSTAAETTQATGLTAFSSTGFTVGALAKLNTNAATYVGWQWKGGSTAVTNTAGTITSQVSANTSAGFSIVTYTGTGATGATVGHGLGIAPKMIIIKNRSASAHWPVGHASLPSWAQNLYLSLTNASATVNTSFNSTAPSSTVFTLGPSGGETNFNGNNFVAYCFAEIEGFSRFGSYTGTGAADGMFVYTGHKPRWIMLKNASAAGNGWLIIDTSRSTFNQTTFTLFPHSSGAETNNTTYAIDIVSNGFKVRATDPAINGSTNNIIYAAFAENPFKNSLAR